MGCYSSRNRNFTIEPTERHRKVSKHSTVDFQLGEELFIPTQGNLYSDIQELYHIEKPISKGKFGSVYIGTSKITNHKVALKIQTRENESSILSELRIIKKLDHPNIIKCFETFQDSKFYYIISEFCSGGELITSTSSFTEMYTKEVIYKLLSAVSHMNSLNIAHCDLKPENVLLDSEGEVKIIDFGLSKTFSYGVKMTEVSGTPLYMAPEIANGLYGPECDLWSIGVIMYYMLTGNPLNLGANKAEILKNLKSGNFEIGIKGKGLSEDAEKLLKRLLEKNPQKRIRCREALVHDWLFKGRRDSQIPKGVLEQVKTSAKLPKAQFLILSVAVGGLSHSETALATRWFQGLDNLHAGVLKFIEKGEEIRVSYTEFLICVLRDDIVKKTLPMIYQWCLKDGEFEVEVLRDILCRRGTYVSYSLLSRNFANVEEFQNFFSQM